MSVNNLSRTLYLKISAGSLSNDLNNIFPISDHFLMQIFFFQLIDFENIVNVLFSMQRDKYEFTQILTIIQLFLLYITVF